ncbi:hypothetical protein SAMN04489745_3116 [Arthrobacter woluwensis]|uniref:Uncharacterized protein n=1 Tax=Arthrobacter woluwensis TaxID=156980 RepID=A0A1H4TB56_9MICC|nr:hypothetical protein SAMN04489745_0039 [Arthrobacter woluwensis]SEC53549.1 hypothetical protein SAMN04489745_3116 [Arthrobacter woluwensis]
MGYYDEPDDRDRDAEEAEADTRYNDRADEMRKDKS